MGFVKKCQVSTRIEESFPKVQRALNELGLKNLTTKKEVPPRYLLVQYQPGWGKWKSEIELVLTERENGSEILIKWSLDTPVRYKKTEQLIHEFESRLGAIDIPIVHEEKMGEKHTIIKEVVLIQCSYCGGLMPQTSLFCPNCGARRKG